ncbi:bifunctional phosphoribosyl-AMP cyclohydrolase/phosphoribosyl-ATP diphosphatase HisIE [Flavobacteriaceae bacterium]|jgi:phosphoribosyl-ATP pyrophosphohydrolase/phosphoribosyl-AMP cyclohydrolase|nr:bifunctional phosphoribosyl-AMP cyclohydrolase/phosphoribosyl-ATP diphosphatase HisIE [Flavobacteriaceae bacterium]MDA8644404.1 bifunctional phosphoribosyl-AMP cyclohydrolase/phosphoribosyl-ATP diphosphatase HisIE [Flavobacteriaceae bacterium]MDA8877217.1 bifunctional phosphoribosyl-AMP cyclohydrolase/phosphoribosyl-ATP diphosphatase HisIE [Flavobacteriaceae bacterium]MDA9038342.1 bifunctional phosphoribosyl-AMP cyclohydrolase/phosphoribosyl-ATP diphosphatase HisIE [Flavobacteriaceae bacteriu
MKPDFSKSPDQLIPAVIQDAKTQKVLMLGYMNEAAFEATQKSQKVTFYSRSKQRLWTKGEESGNFLNVDSIHLDCDQDGLLIYANPEGPTCHKGTDTCWGEQNVNSLAFIAELEAIIAQRKAADDQNSYVASLFREGINKIAQKVGEEAVETVIEAKDNNDQLFLEESADLLFHYLVLLQAKGFKLNDIARTLSSRNG